MPRRTPGNDHAAGRPDTLAGIAVEVVAKRVKNLNLRVYPPDGRVRLTVPRGTSRADMEALVAARADWIRRHQRRFRALPQPRPALYVSGEVHYVGGRPYGLELLPGAARRVTLTDGRLRMGTGPACDRAARERRLEGWYRRRLQEALPPLIDHWERRMGVAVAAHGVKRMSTRWGSCNPRARRVWFNLELVKRRPELLEYVVVHELAHLLVADHGPRFQAVMTRHLPEWRRLDAELDAWPLWARLPE